MTIRCRAVTLALMLAAFLCAGGSARGMEGQLLGQVVSLTGSAYAAGEPRRRELSAGVGLRFWRLFGGCSLASNAVIASGPAGWRDG